MADRISPGMKAQRDATANNRMGVKPAPLGHELLMQRIAREGITDFHLTGLSLGMGWSRGNATAVLMAECFNLMSGIDAALAVEFVEQMAIIRRTADNQESPEHLAAQARVGGILVEYGEIDHAEGGW